MGNVIIKSEDQSGGITAQNVNTGTGSSFSALQKPEREGLAKSLFWWIFGLLGAAAAILTVIKFFIS